MNNILLDLDQTLIAALSPDELDEKKHSKKMKKFKYYNMDGDYTIFERPYLQEFLDYLFDKIPSLASLNQTERKILILTVIGSKPKEIGSVLNLNDQYIRNVKSKIKKLLPEELQNAEWEQLRKLDLV